MPLKTHQDETPQMNLTPMIDVVFLLIVFFMGASQFATDQRDIDLKLPEVAQADASDSTPKTGEVAVYPGGRITLDGADVTLPQLATSLAEQRQTSPNLGVVILGDAGCEFQHIAAALAACKEGGISELAVSVRIAQVGEPRGSNSRLGEPRPPSGVERR